MSRAVVFPPARLPPFAFGPTTFKSRFRYKEAQFSCPSITTGKNLRAPPGGKCAMATVTHIDGSRCDAHHTA